MSLEIITAVLVAGVPASFMLNGQYIELIDAQYPVDVLMQDRSGGMVGTLKGAEVSFYSRPRLPFGQVQLISAQAQVVRFFVGDGDAGTRRISSTVAVVDGGRARTNAGVAYSATPGQQAVAGVLSSVQLWNPISATRRLIVKKIGMGVQGNASAVYVYPSTINLATALPNTIANKIVGAAPGNSTSVRVEAVMTGLPIFGLGIYGAFPMVAGGFVSWEATEPIVVGPGSGITAITNTLNTTLTAQFEWFEESI